MFNFPVAITKVACNGVLLCMRNIVFKYRMIKHSIVPLPVFSPFAVVVQLEERFVL